MTKSGERTRDRAGGRYVVEPGGKTRRGEEWVIKDKKGRAKTVITSPSSAAAMDEITTRHASVLRRLAKR